MSHFNVTAPLHKGCKEPSAPRTKLIEVRYHFSERQHREREDTLIHVPTHDQLADIFTKPLDQATFTRLREEAWCVFDFLRWVCGSSFVAYL
jgi:hypothetical protein